MSLEELKEGVWLWPRWDYSSKTAKRQAAELRLPRRVSNDATTLGKQKFPKKLNVCLPCDLEVPFLDTYPRGESVHIQALYKTFTAAFFMIAPNCKQPDVRPRDSG